MKEFTEWVILFCATLVVLLAVYVIVSPEFWWVMNDWMRRKKKTPVRFKFIVDGKRVLFGSCEAIETAPLGTIYIMPEHQLGEYVIMPVRHVKTEDMMKVPPIRVKKNSVCELHVEIDI